MQHAVVFLQNLILAQWNFDCSLWGSSGIASRAHVRWRRRWSRGWKHWEIKMWCCRRSKWMSRSFFRTQCTWDFLPCHLAGMFWSNVCWIAMFACFAADFDCRSQIVTWVLATLRPRSSVGPCSTSLWGVWLCVQARPISWWPWAAALPPQPRLKRHDEIMSLWSSSHRAAANRKGHRLFWIGRGKCLKATSAIPMFDALGARTFLGS